MSEPLGGIRVVNTGINVPIDVAAGRLAELGARVTKVEPPPGDPLLAQAPEWYATATAGQEIVALDLKDDGDRARLDELLGMADVMLASNRPSALVRLGLGPDALAERFPRLVSVGLVGYPEPREDVAGHDLTYQAVHGLVAPPALPRTLVADLAAAERVVSTVCALLFGRERGDADRHRWVAIADAAETMALPYRHGITSAGAVLGGGFAPYGLYEAREGWVALAALESHFAVRLALELGVELEHAALAEAFRARTASEWEAWADERDLPIAAVRGQ